MRLINEKKFILHSSLVEEDNLRLFTYGGFAFFFFLQNQLYNVVVVCKKDKNCTKLLENLILLILFVMNFCKIPPSL